MNRSERRRVGAVTTLMVFVTLACAGPVAAIEASVSIATFTPDAAQASSPVQTEVTPVAEGAWTKTDPTPQPQNTKRPLEPSASESIPVGAVLDENPNPKPQATLAPFVEDIPEVGSGNLSLFWCKPNVTGPVDGVIDAVRLAGMVFSVVPQPVGDSSYVSRDHVFTDFTLPRTTGLATVLLAHSYTNSGNLVKYMDEGFEFETCDGGKVLRWRIVETHIAQALEPHSTLSDFVFLDDPGRVLTAGATYQKMFGNTGKLVYQTCYEVNGESSWGRIWKWANPIGLPAPIKE